MTNVSRCCHRIVAFVALLIALSIAAPTHTTHAQDATATPMDTPTGAPTSTPTDTATATATWTPIPTPTDTPTDTPTELSTLTETPSPTETATLAEMTPEVTETATPSATETETITPTSTETPTETLTASPTETSEPAWTLIHFDDFETRHSYNYWYFYNGGLNIRELPEGDGKGIVAANRPGKLVYRYTGMNSLDLNLRYMPVARPLTMTLLANHADGYSAVIDTSGSAAVYRNDVLLSSAVFPLTPLQWYQLRFTVFEGRVTLAINAVVVIDVIDPNPLPAGGIQFSYADHWSDGFWLDDIAISTTAEDLAGIDATPAEQSVTSQRSANLAMQQSTANFPTRLAFFECNVFAEDPPFCDIHAYNPDGSTTLLIPGGGHTDAGDAWHELKFAEWSSDGTHIAYTAEEDTFWSHDLYVKNMLNPSAQPVHLNDHGYCPSWSYDNTRIAYTALEPLRLKVEAIDGSSSVQTQITAEEVCPDMSPKGDWVVYADWSYPFSKLVLANATDLSDQRVLFTAVNQLDNEGVRHRIDFTRPVWSPDGEKIVFAEMNCVGYSGTNPCWDKIFIMDVSACIADFANCTVDDISLTLVAQTGWVRDFSWRWDGTQILFYEMNFGIKLVDAEANATPVLIPNTEPFEDENGNWIEYISPAWSPNNDWIAVSGGQCCGLPWYMEIFVFSLDGSQQIPITNYTDPDIGGLFPFWEPLPIPSGNVTYTNINMQNEHSELRAGIFFALWNETSEDREYSGRDEEITFEGMTNSDIETLFRDDAARAASSFLVTSPYCVGTINQTPDEPPASHINWSPNIAELIHCEDHRYMDASVIINGYLNTERTAPGYDPNDEVLLMGAVYSYLSRNFGGTFGRTAQSNPLWNSNNISGCYSAYISSYPVTLTSDTGVQYTYNEIDLLFNHIAVIYDINAEIARLKRERTALDPNSGTYQQDYQRLTDEIAAQVARKTLYPGLYRLQGTAIHYINGILECTLNNSSDMTIRLKFERVNNQISRAINDFYAQVDDPTFGAFNRRGSNVPNPNRPGQGVTIAVRINQPIDQVTSNVAESYYSNRAINPLASCSLSLITKENSSPDISQFQFIDALRSCYFPGDITRIQPVLHVDVQGSIPTQFIWLSVSYGISGTPIDRYGIDICVDYQKCK